MTELNALIDSTAKNVGRKKVSAQNFIFIFKFKTSEKMSLLDWWNKKLKEYEIWRVLLKMTQTNDDNIAYYSHVDMRDNHVCLYCDNVILIIYIKE